MDVGKTADSTERAPIYHIRSFFFFVVVDVVAVVVVFVIVVGSNTINWHPKKSVALYANVSKLKTNLLNDNKLGAN